ncbi:MAG TPA: chaperone modulator CbpM [Flavitalea sp.]|nr:chaperone modulator CbpM [Flavitalea sp.]
MENEKLVTATDFCSCHEIEVSFIQSLTEFGLIEPKVIEEELFLTPDELAKLERMVALHYEMNINLEGIDAITHLLGKIERMQNEITQLRNKLRFYE